MARSSTSGQGRPKGALNKATADLKALAGKYGPEAIERLYSLMTSAENEGAQIAAAKELLDRGFGKVAQPIAGSDEDAPIKLELVRRVIVKP